MRLLCLFLMSSPPALPKPFPHPKYISNQRTRAQIAEHINVDQLADDEDEDVVGGALGGPPGSRRSRGVSHAESVASLRTPMHTGPQPTGTLDLI
jgi:hypothetical protein